ncbi:MAG: hypothetical protein KME20_25685 [Kaiparowitsia implicata GSE-PSE-MK54-09C]|nr:hypothetical protein [Kaiparowitsia implicata GSE-PSE-MK54-09C]
MQVLSLDDQLFYSSAVLEFIVPVSLQVAFCEWHEELTQATSGHDGFLRIDRCDPLRCADGVDKWYTIVHFDTPNHLNDWIESGECDRLLQQGQHLFEHHKFKSFTTGLEGWFSPVSGSHRSLGLPPWKQVLSVVLGLYPTIALQSLLFERLGLFQAWPTSASLLVSILISSTLLTWLVMPLVVRLLRFWLRPAFRRSPRRLNLIGIGLIVTALGLMMLLFQAIAQ